MPLRPLCHAVVVGGSMAGLLATRVLADYFEHVTLLERDTLARSPEPRKGVPQGRHVHVLLLRGRLILDRLFPGLSDELRADGAVLANLGRDLGWHHAGGWRARFDSDLSFLAMSRPLLEFRVAERVRALPNAAVRDGVRVDRLHRDSRNTVAGVRLTSPGTPDRAEEIGCDLVVDATGRGSATPRWLAEQGFAPPREDLLPARVTYATCMFPRSEHGPEQQAVLVTGAPAKRSGGLFPIEGDRWLVTLASFFDAPTPHDYDSFLAFARSLDAPDIYTAIRDLRPLSAVAHYRFAGSLRRRYERLARLPDGLIVIGDGVCSFNPVYGQGMTVSAMEAECLARLLAEAQRRGGLAPDFERRWFRAITPVVDAAWSGVSLEDLLFPELARQRPARLRPLQWYMNRVHRATHRSPAVADQFYRVANFLDPATALFRPRIAADVLFGT